MTTTIDAPSRRPEWVPYLYLVESATLADLAAIAEQAGVRLIPKERYYYRYKDALRIIDFVQAEGIYDGWAVLVRPEDRPRATELLLQHPDLLLPFAEVERRFLDSLSTPHLRQAIGSQHMHGIALDVAMQLLAERQQPITTEAVAEAQAAVRIRNAEQHPKVQWATWSIWTGVGLLAILYLVWLQRC